MNLFPFIQRLMFTSAIMAILLGSLSGAELLTDGNFDFNATILGWDLEESIYDQGTMIPRDFGNVNSAQNFTFGPQSGVRALYLRAFVGGQAAGPDALTNAKLSQTVPGVVGQEYTFSGWSRWEFNYSGAANTLNQFGPLGAVPSPTTNFMKLSFLDGTGAVIGAPVTLDLRTEQNNLDVYRQHTLVGVAPAGTESVQVSADATAMLWNGGGSESAFYDNFSLTRDGDPMAELLANNDLEDVTPFFDPAWNVTEVPGGGIPNDPTISVADFANRPGSGGQLGAWLRSFTGNASQPADAVLSQTVPGIAGGDYTFSGWSNFQPNYSGGIPSFNTQTLMELAFLNGTGDVIGTPEVLDLFLDGQTNGAGWRQHSLNGIAPAGTAAVRVKAAGLGMQSNPAGGQQSAFLDGFSLIGPVASPNGDFNGDGNWNCMDINALTAAIAAGSNDLSFDMNGDGVISLADVTAPAVGWLAVGGANNSAATGGRPFLTGDATLDGTVDGQDFIVWNGNKFTSSTGWCSANFNADSAVDGQDFILWNANKFTSSDSLSAVPEPAACGLLTVMGVLAVSALNNRHRDSFGVA